MPTLSTSVFRATFTPESGSLSSFIGPDGVSLIDSIFCWHGDGQTRFTEKPDKPADRPFNVLDVKFSDTCAESTLRSDKLEIRRCFELSAKSQLLRVSYTITPIDGATEIKELSIPQIAFSSAIADPFDDERDFYSDGAEMGDGREMPCWRVFFGNGKNDGLILATRTKWDMSHLQIRTRGFEFYPHTMIAYDTNMANTRVPMKFDAKHRSYVASFEIGPWSRAGHKSIVRGAKLEEPVEVNHPKPAGRPGRMGRGKVFYATRFGASAANKAFKRNRWLVARVPWAKKGTALVAGTGVKTPALVLKPRLKGTYRVFVGIGNGAGVKLKVSGMPESIFRVNSCYGSEQVFGNAFDLRLAGRHRPAEVDCGVIEMDAKKTTLRLERYPDQHSVSMIDYVRLEPLSPAQARAYAARQKIKPCIELAGFNDVPDIAGMIDAMNPSPEAFRANVWEHARCGFTKINWRIDGQCADYQSKVNTMRYVSARVHGVYTPQSKAYGHALKKFDMLKLAVDAGKKYGVEIWGWMRFNYYYTNVQSDFFKQHPEYWEEWENGARGGKLCLMFPEVRKHKVDVAVEAAGYGLQGIQLGFLRHPPMFHYHPKLVEGYTQKYGTPPPRKPCKDIVAEDAIKRGSLPEAGLDWERWYQYRADFLTQFGRELRAELRNKGLGHVKISIWVRPNHALFDGIDVPAWLNEGLCDEIVADAQNSVDVKLPITEPTAEWKRAAQEKVKVYRGVYEYNWAKQHIPRFIREGYDGVCTYESDLTVLDSRFIGLYDSLRRKDAMTKSQ